MGLTINTASSLLKQIVGLTGTASYLALSSTEPDPSGKGSNGYNITEPPATDSEGHATNYARATLYGHFKNSAESISGGLVDGVYTVSIKNFDEIHFPEALADWGNYKWFAIFEDATVGTGVKYVGELLKFAKDTTVTATNYVEKVEADLYYFDSTQNDYIKITDEAFVEGRTYYIKDNSGIDIEEGTVPLVRKGYLKISVQ